MSMTAEGEINTPAGLRDLAGQGVIGAAERPPLIIRCCEDNQDQTVAAGHSIDPARWQTALDELLGRIAGRFTRVESRRRARAFVCGLLADLPARTAGRSARRRVRGAIWPVTPPLPFGRSRISDRALSEKYLQERRKETGR